MQVIVEMVGLAMGADHSTLGEWLRPQFPKSVEAVLSVNRDFVAEAAFLKIQGSDLFIATGPKQIPSSGGALRTAEAQSRQIQFVLRVLFVLTACCFAAPCRLYRAGEDFFGIWSIDRPRLRRLKTKAGEAPLIRIGSYDEGTAHLSKLFYYRVVRWFNCFALRASRSACGSSSLRSRRHGVSAKARPMSEPCLLILQASGFSPVFKAPAELPVHRKSTSHPATLFLPAVERVTG